MNYKDYVYIVKNIIRYKTYIGEFALQNIKLNK